LHTTRDQTSQVSGLYSLFLSEDEYFNAALLFAGVP